MSDVEQEIVHIDGISKKFGATLAVDNLNLKIAAGEFVTFLGPSGCGKSTTLRILGGFEQPDTGRIVLDGEDVTRQSPNKRKVNTVFQDYALFPHMTVRQNVSFGLELKGLSQNAIATRLDEVLSFLELGALRDRRPDQLSGGQRQRAALARALAPDPSLLLLDEPLGALDAKLRAQVQVELKEIQRRTGKTFIFVTHDQDEALVMSDRIVVMNEGKLEQVGTPEDLYNRPTSRFVAEFVGETNLISADVRGVEAESVALDWGGVTVRGHAYDHAPTIGSTVTAAVRPEHIRVSDTPFDNLSKVSGTVASLIFRGNRTSIDVKIPDAGNATVVAYVTPERAHRLPPTVFLSWEEAHMAVLRD